MNIYMDNNEKNKVLVDYVKKNIDSLNKYRSYFMGVSMLAVILFHAYFSWGGLFVFKYGFIGVDIFLFLSGYGLCFSYNKNTIWKFWKRRFKRIMPQYIVYALIATILGFTLSNRNVSVWDLFCNITTLSYYDVGGWFIDWYLAALVIFYVLFPLLYSIVNLKTFIILLISACLFFMFYDTNDIEWKYICFLARIPIFCLGIVLYRIFVTPPTRDSLRQFSLLIVTIVCLGLFLLLINIFDFIDISKFFVTSLFTPVFIVIICWLRKFLPIRIIRIVEFLGVESLMIYLSNNLSQLFMEFVYFHNPYRLIMYFFLNIVFIGIIYLVKYKRLII